MLSIKELRTATVADLPPITTFLKDNGLPTDGVEDCVKNFTLAIGQNVSIVGVAGFEQYGESCLLRSVAVDQHHRGQGYGRVLVETVLKKATAQGVKRVYLLTEDAGDYFGRLGFEIVDRKDVDGPVLESTEFTGLCSENAIAMRKTLI